MPSPDSYFSLPVPFKQNLLGDGSTIGSAGLTNSMSADLTGQLTPVYLGRRRRLTNISLMVYLAAWYLNVAVGQTGGTPSNAIVTFQLFRNQQQVYASSAQLTLPTILINPPPTGVGGFQNQTAYGIFSDLVNPIEIRNGDTLSYVLTMEGYDLYLSPPDHAGAVYGLVATNLQLTPGGLLYFKDEDA